MNILNKTTPSYSILEEILKDTSGNKLKKFKKSN